MSEKLKGKIVVVTGATAGIGKATAELFKKRGATVVCMARRLSDEFDSVRADVTDADAVKAAISEIRNKYGRIDVLVNNAGMGISGAAEDTDTADVRRIFELNFFGMFNVTREVIPVMRENGGGVIVNVSSVAAELAIPFQSFYSATKAALSSFSAALRNEVAPFGIKVTCVLPGDVKTDFTAARRKNASDNPAYGDRVARSVAVMERDEKNGMPPEVIAKLIVRLASSSRPPVSRVGGGKYVFLVALSKVLPPRLVSYILGKITPNPDNASTARITPWNSV